MNYKILIPTAIDMKNHKELNCINTVKQLYGLEAAIEISWGQINHSIKINDII